MSTGNDTALPPVTDQTVTPAPADTAAPAATETAGLTFTSPQPTDPDDVELNAAKTEVQAEKASDGAAPGTDGNNEVPASPPAAASAAASTDLKASNAQPQPQGQQPRADTPLIPKVRFDQEVDAKNKAEQAAAYWQGVAKAREPVAAPQPGQQQQQAAPTPQQKLDAIAAEQDALAVRLDKGEIGMLEFKQAEREINNREHAIREDVLAAKLKPAPQQQQPASNNDDLRLNELTASLENDHPWVHVFDKVGTDRDWDYLKTTAIDNLVARGIDPTKGNSGKLELRREIAVLADEYGPTLVAKRATAQGIILPSAQPPAKGAQQQPPQRSQTATQRSAKLDLAAGAPPDINSMTGHQSTTPGAPPTDAAIEGMSEADYDKLPAGVRQRLLGISAA